MGVKTQIEYCDSTSNPMMGCIGCELSTEKNEAEGTCYAAELVDRYHGNAGFPKSFWKPQIFPGRVKTACGWSDLRGKERADKPQLGTGPRRIFVDDMGDTWTPGLDPRWLLWRDDGSEEVDVDRGRLAMMEASPHIWMFLTKQATRMTRFFEGVGYIAKNFELIVSITEARTVKRLERLADLRAIGPDATLGVSYEPAIDRIDVRPYLQHVDWLTIGGESGPKARPFNLEVVDDVIDACAGRVPVFVKQYGARPHRAGLPLRLQSKKGGDMREWEEAHRLRQMPRAA